MSKDDLGGHPTKDNASCQRVQDVVMIGQDERVRGCDPEKEGSTVDCDRHVFCNHCGYKRSILFPASLVHCIQTVQCPIVCQSRINSDKYSSSHLPDRYMCEEEKQSNPENNSMCHSHGCQWLWKPCRR